MNAEAVLPEKQETAVHSDRILIVEDERIVARSLREQLTSLGYEVVDSVASGEEAIQKAKNLLPNLVLMDIHLEGAIDGVEAAAFIRRQLRIPVVYLTAYSNMEILERAKTTEPYGYILKPFEERELHVVIEIAIYKHRMEQRQQERERWFAATLKSIGEAVVATDEQGQITYMNPVAERLTGWEVQDALGQALNAVVRLVHIGSRKSVEPGVSHTTAGGPVNAGILLIAKDRAEKDIEDCVAVLSDEQGVAVGKVVVFRDVTWRKRLEETSRQAKKMEAVSQLAGGVAHSFNNLMTTVLGYSEIMLDRLKPGDPFFGYVQEIKRSAHRTAMLTQKLLAFGRRQSLTLRPVDLNAVVGSLEPVIRLMQVGVRFNLNLQAGLSPAKADPDQLAESILALVENAFDAMPHGGVLTIQTAEIELGPEFTQENPEVRPGSYGCLSVSDTGIGMSQEATRHLFEPFYTTDTCVGAGMGLAAVYGFVKQCGGDIDVQSEPGKGTTFRIYLPKHGADFNAGGR